MKPRRYHGLKRPKLRQSWNKYNLYNLSRQSNPRIGTSDHETFFQQKWRAKGILRNYHGEHVVERKWVRMFNRRLLGVAVMDTKYMAQYDGSEQAAGRGSGKDEPPNWSDERVPKRILTPYMQMTFAPMERRLDIAVFRAMFASSARQARQFCVHGAVKVNGKVMPYPAYRLNPGDMFQVDPERVLLATGAPKTDLTKLRARQAKAGKRRERGAEVEEEAEAEAEEAAEEPTSEAKEVETAEQDPDTTDAPEPIKADMKPTRDQIQDLTRRAKGILLEDDLSANQKQRLRGFLRNTKPLLSRARRADASPKEITDELTGLLSGLNLAESSSSPASSSGTAVATKKESDPFADLSKKELEQLGKRVAEYMREEEENPFDPSKPYKTPWRPRNYMSPFAFIPKYLEVNQNICAAVYLRHPVARTGRAEVPTPFPQEVNQLAFNWYLRRR
ncbi:alpha-L RNA-binding motif-containing protein [Hypoxylon sp. FL1857]|nr:alpha-L RNA-binding motif-containing protein [Hypoxylon sp. FL1857]